MEFKKASLQEVDSKPSPTPATVGEEIKVQINPASLRLQLANNVDMGKAFARPNTQYQGSSSSTLSFDLIFDTADEGTTEVPVDVRTRTRQLERFMLPKKDAKAVPPRVLFKYGTLQVVGVMSAMSQEFDLFTQNGVPLRAKCAVTIKEQKPEFDAGLQGPGANTGAGATAPIPPQAGSAPRPPDRTGTALAGESASDFANRMGLDPKAWKGLDGIANPLSLAAGALIDFSSSLSADVGLGVEVSATAGIDVGGSPGGGPGGGAAPAAPPGSAPPGAVPPPGPPPVPTDGGALTAEGGLSVAAARATATRATAAADAARRAFPASPTPATPPAAPAGVPAAATTGVPGVDGRTTSFGFGVPLRPRAGGRTAATVALVHARFPGRVAASVGDVPVTDDPTVPSWQALPPAPAAGAAAARSRHGFASCGCGCGGVR